MADTRAELFAIEGENLWVGAPRADPPHCYRASP